MLDEETASYAEQAIRERGIDLRLNTKGVEFKGRHMADALVLETGETLYADMFIAATGIRPNVAFLQGSGLPVQHGLIVNDALESGSPDIFAAGDVAETVDMITGKRYVHALHPNAVAQGTLVAHNILGYGRTYAGAENINSLKHLGLPMVAVGEISGHEELKKKDGKTLRKIILRDDRIVGFRLVGDIRFAGLYRSLMLQKENISTYKRYLLDDQFSAGWLLSIGSLTL
jgi:NAD(P)H-nitrite reductase large subunit